MTIDVGSGTQPQGSIAPTSWRDLPVDHSLHLKTLIIIAIGIVYWTFMYYVGCYHHPIPKYFKSKMSVQDHFVWRFRVINSYHGATTCILAIIWYITQFTTECSKKNSDLELIMLSHTFGYLLLDWVFMWHKGFLDNGNLLHHFMGVGVFVFSAYLQHNFAFHAMQLLPGEFSNVAMHGREIIKRMGLRYSKIYYLNDYTYYIEYLVCRIFWIPTIYYFIYSCQTANPAQLIFFPFHILMNWYYCSNIPPLMGQRYREIKKIQKIGMKLEWFVPLDSEELKKNGIVSYERYHT
ncbi:transmembrane protein 56 [Stylonychia lemnae]|uniref:Transmembrane protein 56 n=1 Tax=Stylonychia lemnae TaxID=5949 RepID=A0A078A6X0_STYLE|nr:transmembrane protein 56 [Stylonychia lemnae]|eukprot:CDW77989.1 transmembrane protein 56 [Stylonychia lemnae]